MFVDTTSYSTTTNFPRYKIENGHKVSLAYTDMVTLIDAYNTLKTSYETSLTTIQTSNDKYRPLSWPEMALGMDIPAWQECPTWIGEYTDWDMDNTLSAGGYGDPTSGIYTISASNEKLYWGKYGQTTATDSNIDRNTDLTADRYLLITYIAKTGSATTTIATGTASIGTFDSTMTAYMPAVTAPTAPATCVGASWLNLGAALALLLAMIY